MQAHLGYRDKPLTVPCGQCIGCRLERSRVWAVRMVHETQMHSEAIFATLSYDDSEIPSNGSLRPRDMTLFLKRLRKHVGTPVKYYQCGEYGSQTERPHHHIILWGYRPPDSRLHSGTGGNRLFESRVLENLWGHGFAPFGEVTFESCAYCARYITKKVLGEKAEAHYRRVDLETGELYSLIPEYSTMSNGIGLAWIERHWRYTYAHDHVVLRGATMAPPRFYDQWLETNHPVEWERVRAKRERDRFEPYQPRVERLGGDQDMAPYLPKEGFYQARSQRRQRAGEVISNRRLQERKSI